MSHYSRRYVGGNEWLSTAIVIFFFAFMILMAIQSWNWKTDCEDHGGVYLKGAFSYECVVDGHVWKGEK